MNAPRPLPDSGGMPRDMTDPMTPWQAAALHDALDRPGPAPGPGDALAPLWHFVYFRERSRGADLGHDGHVATGGFIPDTGLPRRMWAGGRLEFYAPLRLGDAAQKVSAVQNVALKQGGAGPLSFVTIRHEISAGGGLAVREQQNIVYREMPRADDPPRPRPPIKDDRPVWSREMSAESTLLFRYSALTYNSHKIHYDLEHARDVEGYRDLVVHGPLLAQLLADLARDNAGRAMRAFEFRAVSPVFRGETFRLCGRPFGDKADLWVLNADNRLAMSAEAVFS